MTADRAGAVHGRTRGLSERQTVGAVGLAVFALHAATACRTVPTGDGGELIAAAHALGIAHPPGYPLWVVLAHLALALPLGEPALRVNLLSALFGALCCALVAWLVLRWTGSRVAAAGAGLALAVSSSFWGVATVAEVYTLELLLIALLLAGAEQWREGASLGAVVAALALGLGLAHRPTILLALPAAAWLAGPALVRLRTRPWFAAALGLIALVVPVALYGAMMLRSSAEPLANWGRPDTPARLAAHVLTRAYGSYALGVEGFFRAEGWRVLAGTSLAGFAWIGAAVALAGLASALGARATRRPAVATLALAVPAALFGLSYATQDLEVLFLPVHLALALCLGLVVDLVRRRAPAGPAVAAGLAALVVGLAFALHLPVRDLSRVTVAADYAADLLHSVPPAGVLFVDGDNAFPLAYRIQVLGERPDITVYDRNGLLFRDELRESGSAPRAGETPATFRIRREQEYVTRESRPVLFMTWPGYELPRGFRFDPEGLLYRVRRAGEPGESGTERLWAAYREERIATQAQALGDPFALTLAATYPLMRGERARVERRETEMMDAFAQASDMARASESIHNYLGTVFGRRGDYPRAIAEFELALSIKPVSVRAWNNLALARSLGGDAAGAREAWRRSLALDPNQPDVALRLR